MSLIKCLTATKKALRARQVSIIIQKAGVKRSRKPQREGKKRETGRQRDLEKTS